MEYHNLKWTVFDYFFSSIITKKEKWVMKTIMNNDKKKIIIMNKIKMVKYSEVSVNKKQWYDEQ